MSKVPFYISVALLIVEVIALSIFRRRIWDRGARVELNTQSKSVKASLSIPHTQNDLTLINESSSSSGYGVLYIKSEPVRHTERSIRQAVGAQTIYCKAQFLVGSQAKVKTQAPTKNHFINLIFTS